MKNKKHMFGIFQKLSIAFVLMGLVPLLIMSIFFMNEVTYNVNQVVIGNAQMVLRAISTTVDTMIDEWEENMMKIYERESKTGLMLGEIVLDTTFSESEKESAIKHILSEFDDMSGIKTVRFLDKNGNLYYENSSVGKVVNSKNMEIWKEGELQNRTKGHDLIIDAVHEDSYFANINDDVITLRRNVFDVTSVSTVDDFLGTIYIDLSKDVIGQYTKINLGERSGYLIIDSKAQEIYRSAGQDSISKDSMEVIVNNIKESKYIWSDLNYYYLSHANKESGLISVICVHKNDVLENSERTKNYVISTVFASSILLLLLYFTFSKRISVPIRTLQKGMESIQQGDLKTRVNVRSNDEVALLADGLNQMAIKLENYIGQVYIAEIKQKDAELNALKSQIKPHYLYNTLDVIRMTAMSNEDRKTAEMIECLVRQLRYLMGNEGDAVSLEMEVGNIQDYFKLMRIRYENRIELSVNIANDLKNKKVLKLLLQPIVENAVKHGLKEKDGIGRVWVTATSSNNIIKITIMDDGVGMDEETLLKLREKMKADSLNINNPESGGVGLVNVNDRIHNRYGYDYGIQIESKKNEGTMVIVSIPFAEEVKKNE